MPLSTKVPPFNAPDYDVFTPARRSDLRGVVLGAPLNGGQSYVPWIGLSTVRELALKHEDRVGLVERERLEMALDERNDARTQLIKAQNRVAELEARQERIAGFVTDGYKLVRIQGRPKKVDE